MIRKTALLLTCLLAAVCIAAASGETVYQETRTGTSSLITEKADSPVNNDKAFSGYIQQAFGLKKGGQALRNSVPITGVNGQILSGLTELAKNVAAGKQQSTVYSVPLSSLMTIKRYTAADLGVSSLTSGGSLTQAAMEALQKKVIKDLNVDLKLIIQSMKSSMPYEMYWFGNAWSYGCSGGIRCKDGAVWYTDAACFTVHLFVSSDYSVGHKEWTTDYDTSYGKRIQTAAANAKSIVSANAGKTDYQKLLAYKTTICKAVTYDDNAAAGNAAYGDPWQMVSVFDNDPDTNVVCEGYSKAFKYLCDQSSFQSSVSVSLVSGVMSGGTGAGDHMWNLVKIKGVRYLVDVTNCDDGTIGAPDKLFMAGYRDSYKNGSQWGYVYVANGAQITYIYDKETTDLFYESELTVSETDYDDDTPETHTHTLKKHAQVDATCTKAGTKAYWECTVCGKLFSDSTGKTAISKPVTVPKTGHTLKKHAAVAATCTKNGTKAYWECTKCGKLFSDSKGTTEIKAPITVTKAHTLKKHAEVAATCTKNGTKAYWECTECGKLFSDSKGKTSITKPVSIPKTGHSLKKHATVAATCTTNGTKAYWECTNCGKLFSDSKGKTAISKPTAIPKLGHQWKDVTYTWSKDNKTVTATRVCKNDSSHKQTETVKTTAQTTAATYMAEGKTVYTATFKNTAFKKQTKTVTIPKAQPQTPEEKIKAFVTRCYEIILGRSPDPGGLETWYNELNSGRKAASEIIDRFVNSQEFLGKHYSNDECVEILYKTMLGRTPDAAGKAHWVAKLDAGQPFAAVINGFCISSEFKGICESYGIRPGSVTITTAANNVTGTPAVSVPAKKENTEPTAARQIVLPSEENNDQLGTAVMVVYYNEGRVTEFIQRCYRSILGREPGKDELDTWTAQLMNGQKTPDQIARGFLFSQEFKNRNIGNEELVKILYRVYMNREADPDGLATWTSKLDGGTELKDLLDAFAKTNEFKKVVDGLKD